MKLKQGSVEWTAITPTTVFREDIDNLLGVVSTVADEYTMETETHHGITSVEELATLRPYGVETLMITGKSGGAERISVALGPKEVRVRLATPSADLVGALELCKRIVWRHPRSFDMALTRLSIVMAAASIGGLLVNLGHLDLRSPPLAIAGLVLLVLFLVFVLDGRRRERKHFTRIVLAYGYEVPGWWDRNRDNVVVSFIFLVLGFVLGLASNSITSGGGIPGPTP